MADQRRCRGWTQVAMVNRSGERLNMANVFAALDVPRGTGIGAPYDTRLVGNPKTFVLSGAVPVGARYIVEGSNDGETWDILLDDGDGTEALFRAQSSGAKSVDCIVSKVRVRVVGGPPNIAPPSITMGAPLVKAPHTFGVLDVPARNGLGSPFDLGVAGGALKTVTLRGSIPQGGRYTILASMDGQQFDEAFLFTSDRKGARSRSLMCRYLRVSRAAAGQAPVIAVGAEAAVSSGSGDGGGESGYGASSLTLAHSGMVGTTGTSGEELLCEYLVHLAQLPGSALDVRFSGLTATPPTAEAPGAGSLLLRLGGTPGKLDGTLIGTVNLAGQPDGAETSLDVVGAARPGTSRALVKLSAHSLAGRITARGFTITIHGR